MQNRFKILVPPLLCILLLLTSCGSEHSPAQSVASEPNTTAVQSVASESSSITEATPSPDPWEGYRLDDPTVLIYRLLDIVTPEKGAFLGGRVYQVSTEEYDESTPKEKEKLAKELPQTAYPEVDPFAAEDASEVLEKLKHMKFWLAEERPIPYSHPWGMLIDNAYLRAGDWKLEAIRFDNLINLTYGTTIYIYNIEGENGEEPEDIYEILSSWYASASGTEFLDIYADLPEDEKPKSGWDRALEELEEDSETE